MISKFAAGLVAALVVTIGALRAADVPPDVQKTIAADYQVSCTAVFNPTDSNLDAAFAYLSPDYVELGVKGTKYTRDQVVEVSKQQMKQLHATVCDPLMDSSVLNADGTITIVESLHVIGTVHAQDGNHNIEMTLKAQDTWEQVKGIWMQSQGQELRSLVKMDGTVVQDESQTQ